MKEKKYGKYIVIAVCVGMILGLSAWAYMNMKNNEEEKSMLEQRIQMELDRAKLNSTRPNYLPEVMFSNLPAFPKDFYELRLMYRYGMVQNEGMVNESYWKQPEWFEGFEDRTLPDIQNYDWHYSDIWGVGVYPMYKVARDRISVPEQGLTFDSYSWVQSSALIELNLGVRLSKAYPSYELAPADPKYGMKRMEVYQDPEEVEKWISFDIDPEYIVLEPSFPIYSYGYRVKVRMRVTVSGIIPPGQYVIGYDTIAPQDYCINDEKILSITNDRCDGIDNDYDGMVDESLSEEWQWQYKLSYTDPNKGGLAVSPRKHRLFIEVA